MRSQQQLDNPVWHSLNETHAGFSLAYNHVKCYHPDCCPFGGYTGSNDVVKELDEYARQADNFFIVGEKPQFSTGLVLKKDLVCLQMVIDHVIDMKIMEEIVRLSNIHEQELFDLVNFVQPGYFKNKTSRLSDYYGIFKNGMLIAVTGERMKMNGYTEVSAVVTHPDHTGKGYAGQLIAYTVRKIASENKTPFLHVAEINTGAIKLYDKLSFRTRRKISFWNLQKK
jgi:ribosomal protein S18 acetylase RimI-like enzyme